MNGSDETRLDSWGDVPPPRPRPAAPQRPQPDSIFFNDDAIDEAEVRRRRAGQPGPAAQGPIGGRPQVLAPTATEWEYDRSESLIERRGPNRFLLFALAALFAALIGVGFAIYSVLNESDGSVAAEGDGSEQAGLGAEVDENTTVTTTVVETTTTIDPALLLDFSIDSDVFVCDGVPREFGRISGADPGEEIVFTSPQSSGISPGQADETGSLPIRWICSPDQMGTTWELTATGSTSGRSGTVVFTGANEAGATSLGELTVDVYENPFTCDNGVRAFATISGAVPDATIEFTSPQATGLRPGTADADGQLNVRWSCSGEQVGTTWELTATETSTGRSVEFSFVGG